MEMAVVELIMGILLLVLSLGLVVAVMLQSGKDKKLSGAIAGGADTFLSKNKAKSLDAKLAKGTKWIGAAFIVLTLVINCMLAAGVGA